MGSAAGWQHCYGKLVPDRLQEASYNALMSKFGLAESSGCMGYVT